VSSTLAIKGGKPAVPAGMVKSWPPITEADRRAVLGVLDSGHLHGTSAPNALKLQEVWAKYIGVKYCLVTNSGTSACHMAVASVGVEPGDEVIVPAFTFWATAAAVLHQNAIPVFVDIDPKTYTIDPSKIEEKITPRTRAIFPVHIHGMPCDMDPIKRIAKKHNLAVIEDACQAHGATYKGKKCGALGDAAAFSLNRSKNLTGCEGGLYTTNDENMFKFARKLREFGEVIIQGKDREYNAYGLGWMYRATEFANAFALSQFKRLERYNRIRREMAAYLTKHLKEIRGVEPPFTPKYANPCYFSYVVEFRPDELGLDIHPRKFRLAAEKVLRAEGISMGQWQTRPVPGQTVFQDKQGYGKGCPWSCRFAGKVEYRAEDYPETVKFLDSHSYLRGVYPPNRMSLMKRYVEGFRKVFENVDEWIKLCDEIEI